MQIFPLNLNVFLYAFGHFNKLIIERNSILISFTEVLCFRCCKTTKKVDCRVHVSVISQDLKKLDGLNNRLYVPEINSEQ